MNTGRVVLALRSNGVAQAYFRYVPATYEGVAMPVVVNLHERGSSAIEQVRLSGLDRTAEAHGFVTLTPLGLGDLATWDTGSESADVRFIEKVLDWTAEQLCVDPSRVYATGVGRGGRFATRLADALPGRIVAVKAVDRLPFSAEAVWSYLVDHPLPSEP